MSVEKPSSIICETCGGWHTTEAHAQYEKEAREKRIAEIKARPDPAYRFDTLGFSVEEKEEGEPWIHTVIERAKELGDDLQDSDFFIHNGPLEEGVRTKTSPSVLSFITQEWFRSKQEIRGEEKIPKEWDLFVSEHDAGDKIKTWAQRPGIEKLLVLQERWVQTSDSDDLRAYQELIKEFLTEEKPHSAEVQKLLNELDSSEGRKKAVKFIMLSHGLFGPDELVGVIFKITNEIKEEYVVEEHEDESSKIPSIYINTKEGENLMALWYRGSLESEISGYTSPSCDLNAAKAFYSKLIQGLYIPHGSVEEQREVLGRMLEMTKDTPEQRLPMYNFYGKLIWPRPPEEKKEQK